MKVGHSGWSPGPIFLFQFSPDLRCAGVRQGLHIQFPERADERDVSPPARLGITYTAQGVLSDNMPEQHSHCLGTKRFPGSVIQCNGSLCWTKTRYTERVLGDSKQQKKKKNSIRFFFLASSAGLRPHYTCRISKKRTKNGQIHLKFCRCKPSFIGVEMRFCRVQVPVIIRRWCLFNV